MGKLKRLLSGDYKNKIGERAGEEIRMQDSDQYSRKATAQKGDKEMIQKNMVLIKIGEILFDQGLLTLEEKKDFERMAQRKG